MYSCLLKDISLVAHYRGSVVQLRVGFLPVHGEHFLASLHALSIFHIFLTQYQNCFFFSLFPFIISYSNLCWFKLLPFDIVNIFYILFLWKIFLILYFQRSFLLFFILSLFWACLCLSYFSSVPGLLLLYLAVALLELRREIIHVGYNQRST